MLIRRRGRNWMYQNKTERTGKTSRRVFCRSLPSNNTIILNRVKKSRRQMHGHRGRYRIFLSCTKCVEIVEHISCILFWYHVQVDQTQKETWKLTFWKSNGDKILASRRSLCWIYFHSVRWACLWFCYIFNVSYLYKTRYLAWLLKRKKKGNPKRRVVILGIVQEGIALRDAWNGCLSRIWQRKPDNYRDRECV